MKLSEGKYVLNTVEEKEPRTYLKESQYDMPLDGFAKADVDLVEVTVLEGENPYTLRQKLAKRIERRGLAIKASVSNGKLYLERAE